MSKKARAKLSKSRNAGKEKVEQPSLEQMSFVNRHHGVMAVARVFRQEVTESPHVQINRSAVDFGRGTTHFVGQETDQLEGRQMREDDMHPRSALTLWSTPWWRC